MSFRKYFIEYVLLPYHTAAKKFCPRNSFAYKLFILLNLIWIASLITILALAVILNLL
jgi:hypothetical protein